MVGETIPFPAGRCGATGAEQRAPRRRRAAHAWAMLAAMAESRARRTHPHPPRRGPRRRGGARDAPRGRGMPRQLPHRCGGRGAVGLALRRAHVAAGQHRPCPRVRRHEGRRARRREDPEPLALLGELLAPKTSAYLVPFVAGEAIGRRIVKGPELAAARTSLGRLARRSSRASTPSRRRRGLTCSAMLCRP